MISHVEKQKLQHLVRDTLTLLCKNGMSFDSRFSIEGLIVLTLDDQQEFHLSINETVGKHGPMRNVSVAGSETSEHHISAAKSEDFRVRRKRVHAASTEHVAQANHSSDHGDGTRTDTLGTKLSISGDISKGTDDNCTEKEGADHDDVPAKKPYFPSTETESGDANCEEIIVVKEEIEDEQSIGADEGTFGNMDFGQPFMDSYGNDDNVANAMPGVPGMAVYSDDQQSLYQEAPISTPASDGAATLDFVQVGRVTITLSYSSNSAYMYHFNIEFGTRKSDF